MRFLMQMSEDGSASVRPDEESRRLRILFTFGPSLPEQPSTPHTR